MKEEAWIAGDEKAAGCRYYLSFSLQRGLGALHFLLSTLHELPISICDFDFDMRASHTRTLLPCSARSTGFCVIWVYIHSSSKFTHAFAIIDMIILSSSSEIKYRLLLVYDLYDELSLRGPNESRAGLKNH